VNSPVIGGFLLSFLGVSLWLIIRVLIYEAVRKDEACNKRYHYRPQIVELMLAFLCVVGLIVVYYFQFDFKIADWIYAQTDWVMKKSVIANDVLHKAAKVCLIVIYLYLLFKSVKGMRQSGNTQKGYDLAVLLMSIGLSVSIVSLLKRLLDVDCPWDLIVYGGDKPFFPLFDYNPSYLPSANCFPSSHASVGFSWIAVYFYMTVTEHPHKYKALLAALVMGLLFGVTQQLRGAHFLSHDITSLLICLITTMAVYSLAYSSRVGLIKRVSFR